MTSNHQSLSLRLKQLVKFTIAMYWVGSFTSTIGRRHKLNLRADEVFWDYGLVQTAFVEHANLTLRELIAPLSRCTWSMAYDLHHLRLHIYWGLAYYHLVRAHQSLQIRVRGPSKRRHRTPAMAAGLVDHRWTVADLLLMPLPERPGFPPSRRVEVQPDK